MTSEQLQWILVVGFSLGLIVIAPRVKSAAGFFRATKNGKEPGLWMLTSSLIISWIFAKSITNAANLGLSFGLVGGLAYAAYYLSFVVAGIIIYQLRVKGNYTSIHQFLSSKYGRQAVNIFSLLIGIRLFNEVWSNTMVIGSYFGPMGSMPYYWAIIVFTALTLVYSLKGGLQSSLLTDAIQMGLFGVLLFIILGILVPAEGGNIGAFIQEGSWEMEQGLNLLFVVFIQVFSYPFHDPVLTDRAFLANPRKTVKSFMLAAGLGGLCILLFSFVGIYARMQHMQGQAAVQVAQSLGVFMMLVMNMIMVTSAASTLDSAFAAFSKLAVVDLKRLGLLNSITDITMGRWMMIFITIIGTIPVFLKPEILSATTISGTMVIGLAPVFLCWNMNMPKLSFQLSVGTGVIWGVLLAAGLIPANWGFPGKYGDLLWVNLIGSLMCFALFFLPKWLNRHEKN